MTRTFRVSGKRDILNEFKRQNGRLVEVTGLVKKTALLEPGIKVGGARVLIGSSPMSTDPTRNPARDPVPRIIAIEATSVRFVEETCPATKP